MLFNKMNCPCCRKETIYIVDVVISVGPNYGELMTLNHCQECGNPETVVSYIEI